MGARRGVVLAVLVAAGCSSFEVNGSDAGVVDAGAVDAGPIVDAGADAYDGGPIAIAIAEWTTPNGATPQSTDSGTTISAQSDASKNHPIIIPKNLPDFGSDDYTIYAVVQTADHGNVPFEFGFYFRYDAAQANGYALGEKAGVTAGPFFATLTGPDWNPAILVTGSPSAVATATLYHITLRAQGNTLATKRWKDGDPEPGFGFSYGDHVRTTGRGIGFYTYGVNNTAVVSLAYTVP